MSQATVRRLLISMMGRECFILQRWVTYTVVRMAKLFHSQQNILTGIRGFVLVLFDSAVGLLLFDRLRIFVNFDIP